MARGAESARLVLVLPRIGLLVVSDVRLCSGRGVVQGWLISGGSSEVQLATLAFFNDRFAHDYVQFISFNIALAHNAFITKILHLEIRMRYS